MLALVSGTTKTIKRVAANGLQNVGHLLTPKSGNSIASILESGLPWACDNGAFSGFDATEFEAFLVKISGYRSLFVACPDVVEDARATINRFAEWNDKVKSTGHPVAFVLQDGQENFELPAADAYFIGGSTEFKLSETAMGLVSECKRQGAWIHMGRVNSLRRIDIAVEMGCDSFDGGSMSMFGDMYVEKFCRRARLTKPQARAW